MVLALSPEQWLGVGELVDRPLATIAAYQLDKITNTPAKTLGQHLGNILAPGWNTAFKVRKMKNLKGFWSGLGATLLPRRFSAFHLTKMQYGKVSAGDFVEFVLLGGVSMYTVMSRILREKNKLGYIQLETTNPEFRYIGKKPNDSCSINHSPVTYTEVTAKPDKSLNLISPTSFQQLKQPNIPKPATVLKQTNITPYTNRGYSSAFNPYQNTAM